MGVKGSDPMASKNDGYTSYGYVVTVAESPMVPGILWAGTDDGNVQVSHDSGATWSNVAKNVPVLADKARELYHVARIEPSHYDAGTAYLAVDGHRFDDLKPYLFVTRDYGATWTSIVGNLPAIGNVNVIREDPKNKALLYAGTEFGLFISLDGAHEGKQFKSELPRIPAGDRVVRPTGRDLISRPHGRA